MALAPPCAYWTAATGSPYVTAEHVRLASAMHENESGWDDTPVRVEYDVIRTLDFVRRCGACARCARGGYNAYQLAELIAGDMSLCMDDDGDATDDEQYAFMHKIGPQRTELRVTDVARRVDADAPALLDALHACNPLHLWLYGSASMRHIDLDTLCCGQPLTRTRCLGLMHVVLHAVEHTTAQRVQAWLPSLTSLHIAYEVALSAPAAAALLSSRITELHAEGSGIAEVAPHMARLSCLTRLTLQSDANNVTPGLRACLDAVRVCAPPLQWLELAAPCNDSVLRALRAAVRNLPTLQQLVITPSTLSFDAVVRELVRACYSAPDTCHVVIADRRTHNRSERTRLISIEQALHRTHALIHAPHVAWWDGIAYDAALMCMVWRWAAAHRRGPALMRRALRCGQVSPLAIP